MGRKGIDRDTLNNLAIIPARGGSKRIPRKNIKDFCGQPIIAYSIDVAKLTGLFDEVMVSTDDKQIADCAVSFGASVPFFRSLKASDDFATTMDVVLEVLESYKLRDKHFDNVCVIYPTAPFVKMTHLIKGFEKLKSYNACLPVTEYSFPVWRSFKLKSDEVKYQWPEYKDARSQDLESLYHDAGQWYWLKSSEIKDSLIPEKTAPLKLSNLEVQDIDTPDDWRIAELKYEYLQSIEQ